MVVPAERLRCSERAAQQSNTDQHTSLRNLWSSSTSSRISLGSCARCHWHSRRPACSCSPSGAAARAVVTGAHVLEVVQQILGTIGRPDREAVMIGVL